MRGKRSTSQSFRSRNLSDGAVRVSMPSSTGVESSKQFMEPACSLFMSGVHSFASHGTAAFIEKGRLCASAPPRAIARNQGDAPFSCSSRRAASSTSQISTIRPSSHRKNGSALNHLAAGAPMTMCGWTAQSPALLAATSRSGNGGGRTTELGPKDRDLGLPLPALASPDGAPPAKRVMGAKPSMSRRPQSRLRVATRHRLSPVMGCPWVAADDDLASWMVTTTTRSSASWYS